MGHLKTLTVFFRSIILVFFCLWVPGMIVYYAGYQTNRNASGLLHNLGLILFSLKAIVSNGIALSNPDVKKAFHSMCDEVSGCPSQKNENSNEDGIEDGKDVHSYPTAKTAPASHGRLPAHKWPEDDIEVPIREESSDRRSDFSNTNPPSLSRIVTLHHELTNIGGIQVSQLTTHTISSFNSSSHVGGNDGGDSDDDDDIPEFGYGTSPAPSPRVSRNRLALGDEDKDSKGEMRKKKSKQGENSSAEGLHSGSSEGSFKGRGSQRRNSQRRGSLRSNDSPASLRKKKKKHGGDNGPPKRRLSSSGRGSNHKRSSPVVNSRKSRRSSGSHIQNSGDPALRNIPKRRSSQNGASDSHGASPSDGTSGQPVRSNSRHGTSKSPKGHLRKNRRNSSSHRSGSDKFSIKEIHVTNSPTAQPKKRVSSKNIGSLKKGFSISEIQVINTPTGQPKQTINVGYTPGMVKTTVTDGKSPKISISPVQQMVKKFDNANKDIPSAIDVSKQLEFPLAPNMKKKFTGSTGTNSNNSESANSLRSRQQRRKSIGEPTKRLGDGSHSRGETRRKSVSMRGDERKRFSNGSNSRSPAPVERKRRKSLSLRNRSNDNNNNSSSSRPRRSLSLRESRKISGDNEEPKKNNSDTTSADSLKRISTSSMSNSSNGKKRPSYSKAIFNDGTVVENLSEDFSLDESV